MMVKLVRADRAARSARRRAVSRSNAVNFGPRSEKIGERRSNPMRLIVADDSASCYTVSVISPTSTSRLTPPNANARVWKSLSVHSGWASRAACRVCCQTRCPRA